MQGLDVGREGRPHSTEVGAKTSGVGHGKGWFVFELQRRRTSVTKLPEFDPVDCQGISVWQAELFVAPMIRAELARGLLGCDWMPSENTRSEQTPKEHAISLALSNGSRLSCGALVKKQSYNILRAPPASSAC
jgi:hypothetical protein